MRTRTPESTRFGAIVHDLRMKKGWTIVKLAQRSGLSRQYLTILEQGGNVPSISTVLELADVLGADPAEIMRQLAAARAGR
jgi:transcriptional regulator with XRE-family HTH domain